MRFSRLRLVCVAVAFGLPVAWLAPGCGARSNLDDEELDLGADGGPDAQPDAIADAPIDTTFDTTFDAPVDVVVDTPLDVVIDTPIDAVEDEPIDVVEDTPKDSPIDVVEDVPKDSPIDSPEDSPFDAPKDAPIDVSPDVPCPDNDGDGYTTCDGDCDDGNPLVNPGAFDFPNGVDDDCDGAVDDPNIVCDSGLAYTSQNPLDYAKAIELCQTTTDGATGKQKIWGVIQAELVLADGSGTADSQQHSIITTFGDVIKPRANASFVYMSTGMAGVPGQQYYVPGETPQTGTDTMTSSSVPPGFPTNKAGCPEPVSSTAFNPVNLKLRIRTPTNAPSFAFDNGFYSAEYPEYACSPYNDLWVTLLTTGAKGIANNHNILFDDQGTPGSVNLNFFDRCIAGPTGCSGGTPGFNFCSGGKGELAGTGFDDPDDPCGNPSSIGGGTGWITTEAPVVPGETITIQFIVWDSSDGIYDSGAILDNFRWQTTSLANPDTHR